MKAIDDPTIPDDLSELLRSAAADQRVSPAPLHAVERRARHRRRRRRGALACSASAVVLLTALALVQTTGHGGTEQVVTATAPPASGGSVAQPVLVPRIRATSDLPEGVDPEAPGGILDSITASGGETWWATDGIWYPSSASVLADGRRFGIAATIAAARTDDRYLGARLDRIGPDGATSSSRTIPMEVPDGQHGWIRSIGATGTTLIVQRGIQKAPEIFDQDAPGGMAIEESTSFSALDVDTGAERPIADVEGSPLAAAAGDVLAYGLGTGCAIVVVPLDGGDPRTIEGTCDGPVEGLEGQALRLAVSPDGRYAAVIWNTVQLTGDPIEALEIIDLRRSRVVHHQALGAETRISGLAWTAEHGLTVAMEPRGEPITIDGGGVTVRTITWNTLAASAGPGG